MKEAYAFILVMGSFLVMITEVLLRYIFGTSLEGSDEISRILLVWLTFTGIGLAVRERKEIFVTTVRLKLSGAAKRKWFLFLDLLVFAFNIFLLVYGLQMTGFSWSMQTENLEIPFSFFYISIPLGSAIGMFYLGKRILAGWRTERGVEK